MKRVLPGIQAFRGVLFIFILAFHCGMPYASFGWAGVESFFVISAFFLVRKYWGTDNLIVRHQLKHRIIRLYPSYMVVIFVGALYALYMKDLPYNVIAHLASAQNFVWMGTGYKSPMQPMTAHTWTLSIEMWCGLILVFLLRGVSTQRFKIAAYVGLCIGVSYRLMAIMLGGNVWVISLCPLAHLDAFAVGALLAIGANNQTLKRKNLFMLVVFGTVGIGTCIINLAYRNEVSFIEGYKLLSSSKNYLNDWFTGNIYLFITLLTAGILGVLYLRDRDNKRQEKPFGLLVSLGNYSYEMYLFHWPVLMVLWYFVTKAWAFTFPAAFVITVAGTFAYSKAYAMLTNRRC